MAHEDLSREHDAESSSDRAFGLVFAAVFVLVAAWPLLHGEMPRWWSVIIASLFALVAWIKPVLLAGLNRLWTKLGMLLGKIIGPIALAVIFYGVVTPVGALMRLSGNDPLRLKRDRSADSYWNRREPPGPPPDSMSNQF